jgi:hypothetical protein
VNKAARFFVDPSYPGLGNNRLFDAGDEAMNRDGQMLPFIRLKQCLEAQGASVQTADCVLSETVEDSADYWSFGLTDKLDWLIPLPYIRRVGFLIMEPPLVAPQLYGALPELTRQFERVYVHNTEGDGYSLEGVDASRLRKLYWPQPYDAVQEAWHRTDRFNKSVVIAGRHTARRRKPEYYSLRIQAMAELAKLDAVDLYGRGWAQLWSAQTISWPYLRHYKTLRSIYKGPCRSKMNVLGQYRFSLCLENMPMRGYVTEKIFDCLYAGAVPLYLGAPDIEQLIPAEAYVDVRQFDGWWQAWRYASSLTAAQWQRMRECGREFIAGTAGQRYVHSLENMFLHEV